VWLDAECQGDAALRQRLAALLAAHEQPETLLATQAAAARPTIKLDFADAPDEAVGQTLGRYKLLERVGEGGCGVVYVAEQTEPVRRRVALKVIKLGMDTKQGVARFEAERQALARMDHPNIAKALDAGTTEIGRRYFVMELVRGIKITDYCDQANLSTKDRLDLFIRVCQAIQHAHQKGIIHRDIKPSNILVTLHDSVPVPKVIDFGIAKATEGRFTDATVYTQLHQFIGTLAYMSPEQAEMSGLDIDTRSDIYSLGVLLYELLAGSTPFDAKELMASGIDAMRKTIREKKPPRPSTRLATLGADQHTTTGKRRSAVTSKLLHQLKGDLNWIVMNCVEKDRQRRYETANGLAADLRRHLNNEPVVARQSLWRKARTAGAQFACGGSLQRPGASGAAHQRKAGRARLGVGRPPAPDPFGDHYGMRRGLLRSRHAHHRPQTAELRPIRPAHKGLTPDKSRLGIRRPPPDIHDAFGQIAGAPQGLPLGIHGRNLSLRKEVRYTMRGQGGWRRLSSPAPATVAILSTGRALLPGV